MVGGNPKSPANSRESRKNEKLGTMKTSKMGKFKEKQVTKINDLTSSKLNDTELNEVSGGIIVTLNWPGWFDGSLFREGRINEFDKP